MLARPMILRRLAACALLGPLSVTCWIGCGDDAGSPAACLDPDRIPPPDDTVPYSATCCTSAECAQLGSAHGVCADFGAKGQVCTHLCESNADCKGLGPESCTSGKVCETSAARPAPTG